MKIGNLDVYGIIYKIRNKINNKIYIGQTTNKRGFDGRYYCTGKDIERVYNTYLSCKQRAVSYNEYLLRSIEKYGISNFEVIKIFDIAFSKEELDIKEDVWINYFNCIKNGYNCRGGGANGKMSEKTKLKMKNSKIGNTLSEDTKRKIGQSQKGKLHHKSKKIVCFNELKLFESLRICSDYYECSYSNVSKVCGHKRDETKGFKFMYLEEYLDLGYKLDNLCVCNVDYNKINKQIKQEYKKEIICINNGLIFESAIDCEKKSELIFNIKMNAICIRRVCRGEVKQHRNFKFNFTSDLTEMDIKRIQENVKLK